LLGCSKPATHEATPSATVAASVVASAAPSATVSTAPSAAPAPTEPTCRALRVEGDAKVGEVALRSGAEVDGSEWVRLGAGASLTLKHTVSGREIALAGPALFRACRRGREQVLLAKGKVQGGSGMGSRPGAEVLIATPIAAVRYGDADYTLVLDDKKLTVEVRTGQVEVDAATDKPPPGLKSALRAKDKLSLPLGKPDAASLMARCKAAAENAEATARRVGDRSAPEPLGERAQLHVRARKAARAACTVAAATTGLVADPSAAAGLWAEAARWEGLWETVPVTSRAQPAEK
ncbi:MAG TPA: hypothetical protein VEQ58_18280, partial [Polyangiaceae bacterium]|nr:hypothetical protein [Polyangiaceae bacterium]